MPSRPQAPDKDAFLKQTHTTGQSTNWYDLKQEKKKKAIYQET